MFQKYGFLFVLLPVFLRAGLFGWFDSPSVKVQHAKNTVENLTPLIEKAVIDYQVPGLAIGVVVEGQVVYAKGFGYRNIEKKLPVTKDTLFAIGSCTKAFTTFVMGTLTDEGLVRWDQPVIDIFPEFRLQDQYATANITIRDLLTHRTGMPRHEFVWYNSKMNKSEMFKRIRYLQPSTDIRERYQYGNLMYFTAGLAMESVTGKPWEQLVSERILNPLGMKHTNFSVEQTQKSDNFACPYLEKNESLKKIPFRNLSLIGAAGAINSNAEDMTHWIQMQLAGGVYKSQSLISPATLQELHAPQVTMPGAPEVEDTHLCSYGIGWVIASYRGHYLVSHDGVSDGFTSVVALLPQEDIGIVVLANKNMTPLPRYLSLAVIDQILGLPSRDWFQQGLDRIRKKKETLKDAKIDEDRMRKLGTFPSHSLEDYVGIYENPGYGKLSIELVNGKLEANYNDLLFVLDHWHYDVFNVIQEKQDMVVSFEGSKFTFNNNPNGEIGELMVPFEPTADDIIFKKRPSEKHSALSYLRQFTGVYEIYGYTVEIVIRNQTLVAIIPGQPNYELVPANENEFTVKSMTGTMVRFILDPYQKVQEVLLVYPYGAFSALPRK